MAGYVFISFVCVLIVFVWTFASGLPIFVSRRYFLDLDAWFLVLDTDFRSFLRFWVSSVLTFDLVSGLLLDGLIVIARA